MIKNTALFLALYTLLISAGFLFVGNQSAAVSCGAGGGIMMLNLLSFYLSMKLIFSKKSIALTVLVIIFKYLLLGLVFWSLMKADWIHPVGFVAGFSTLVLAILSMTLVKTFARKYKT